MIDVRLAAKADLDDVVRVSAAAFDDDPVMRWLVGENRSMTRAFDVMARRVHTAPGSTDVARDGGTVVGASMWDPPGKPAATGWRKFTTNLAWWRALGGNVQRGAALDEAFGKLKPDRPYWYLGTIGATERGRGIGTALMAYGIARVDRDGTPAWLESSKRENLPLYERYGFRVVDEITLPDGGPVVWPMLRDLQSDTGGCPSLTHGLPTHAPAITRA